MTDTNSNPTLVDKERLKQVGKKVTEFLEPENLQEGGWLKLLTIVVGGILLLTLLFSILWSRAPGPFDVRLVAQMRIEENEHAEVIGYVTTSTLIEVATQLLSKSGGYLSNDKLPPGVFMDNITNWEWGVLQQIRDFTGALRNDFSRAPTIYTENEDLTQAHPKFNVDNTSWMVPSAEGEYWTGIEYVENYLNDLGTGRAQFYARADNLRDWLKIVGRRLESLSQRLSASLGESQSKTNEEESSTNKSQFSEIQSKTPWLKVDDVFYEARGTSWALVHLLRAIEIDFKDLLQKRGALASLQQIIRKLETTQSTVWSPMILNGSEFGIFANHSLVMSSYISNASNGINGLRDLLLK